MLITPYPLGPGQTLINAPGPAEPLFAGLDPQGNNCVWLKVIPSAPIQEVSFLRVGTGHEFEGGEHVASYCDGRVEWHVFQEGRAQ